MDLPRYCRYDAHRIEAITLKHVEATLALAETIAQLVYPKVEQQQQQQYFYPINVVFVWLYMSGIGRKPSNPEASFSAASKWPSIHPFTVRLKGEFDIVCPTTYEISWKNNERYGLVTYDSTCFTFFHLSSQPLLRFQGTQHVHLFLSAVLHFLAEVAIELLAAEIFATTHRDDNTTDTARKFSPMVKRFPNIATDAR